MSVVVLWWWMFKVKVVVRLWKDGFTLNDEEFRSYSVQENQDFLEAIKRGYGNYSFFNILGYLIKYPVYIYFSFFPDLPILSLLIYLPVMFLSSLCKMY